MIYTITINPALDYVLDVESLQTKDINKAQSDRIYYGGKGINVSVILSRLKVDNTALGFLAGFTGRHLEEMLKAEKIRTDFLYLDRGDTRINVKIRAQYELDINAPGPEINEKDIKSLLKKLGRVRDGDFIVLAGSAGTIKSDDIYERILEHLDGRDIKAVIDTTGNMLLRTLKYKPFLIKPNHHELGALFGVELDADDEMEKYAKELQKMGASNVLVSRGEKGAFLMDKNANTYRIDNFPGTVLNTTGCGDSMVAGFIAGYIERGDFAYALKLGTACANATAFSPSLARADEIKNIVNSNILTIR